MKKDKIYDNITKYLHENEYVKTGTQNFETVKDLHISWYNFIKNELRSDIKKKELHIQTHDIMHFFLY